MKKVQKIAQALLNKAKAYKDRKYCECGCKNREDWDHGAFGKYEYEKFMKELSPSDAKLLAKTILQGEK